MTAHELMEWQAYEQVFGSILLHERIDQGFAQVSLILAQAFGKPGRHLSIRDFMPEWFRDLTAEDELARGMAAIRMMKGTDADR